MDKLISIVRLIQEQNQQIGMVDHIYELGGVNPDEAFEATIDIIDDYTKKIKNILNEPVKITKKQFMKEQFLHGARPN